MRFDVHGKPQFTIEERAERWQRRYTGPWQTVDREIGPVVVTTRYRRRARIEFLRLNVAGHDLWTHVLLRGTVRPALLPFVRAAGGGSGVIPDISGQFGAEWARSLRRASEGEARDVERLLIDIIHEARHHPEVPGQHVGCDDIARAVYAAFTIEPLP